jgi:hypothetical protein
VQDTNLQNRSHKALAKTPPQKARLVCDDEIKSVFAFWKQAVETYSTSYDFEFDREEDEISLG